MASVPININGLNVPSLAGSPVWFANAAAWSAYWSGAGFTASIQVADSINFGVVKAAATNVYAPLPVIAADSLTVMADPDGTGTLSPYVVPLNDAFLSLYNSFIALKADYDVMRASLVAAGLVTA